MPSPLRWRKGTPGTLFSFVSFPAQNWTETEVLQSVPIMRIVASPTHVLVVDEAIVAHPLFGRAHPLRVDDRVVTAMGVIDWLRPTTIPPIEHPARLPRGTGTLLLNAIAERARDAGVTALRYAGPYPTAALWASLLQSFSTTSDEATFIADAEQRAIAVTMTPIAVDFVPAPFVRQWIAPNISVQLRAHLERVAIDGLDYSDGIRRLVTRDDGIHAEVWFGDTTWADVATFAADGELCAGPHALPVCTDAVIGQRLPPQLCAALAALIADASAHALTTAIADEMAHATITWGDAGASAAIDRGDHIILHAAIWQRIAPSGMARLALAMAEALTPIIARRAQQRLAARWPNG